MNEKAQRLFNNGVRRAAHEALCALLRASEPATISNAIEQTVDYLNFAKVSPAALAEHGVIAALDAAKAKMADGLKPFTVLLKVPDYIPDDDPRPLVVRVMATDRASAIAKAQEDDEDERCIKPTDYQALHVFAGHLTEV